MNKRMLIFLSTTLTITFLALAAPGATPSTAKGTIHGIVTDPSGAAIPGAAVMVSDGQTVETVSTDETGQYTLAGLVPGHYHVHIRSAGFSPFKRSGLVLSAGYETEA